MKFECFEVSTGRIVGICTLPDGVIDPNGTEHQFGDDTYILVETQLKNKIMYFCRSEKEKTKILKCSCGCGKEQTVKVGGAHEVMAFGCKESIEITRQKFLIEYGLTDRLDDKWVNAKCYECGNSYCTCW